ncbi:Uncharacterised protein [Achromobacter xylosoxidans]|nr:Uncharacterised protein [Achromobacter xylosoxidans]
MHRRGHDAGGGLALDFTAFHLQHPFGAGAEQDADLRRLALHQGGELGAGQRARGGEDAHHAAARQVRGRLDGWFHADDRQVRMAGAEGGDGGGRGGVAGHHHGLGPARHQVVGDGQRPLLDVLLRLLAVGHVGGVGHVQQVLVRQGLADGAQHAQSADAGVVYADGMGGGHGDAAGTGGGQCSAIAPGPRLRGAPALPRSGGGWRRSAARRARSA